MIALAMRCHRCCSRLSLDDSRRGGWIVYCQQCVDPEGESPSERLQGRGETPDDALQNWFDRREQLGLEPEPQLAALSTFIVPRSPEGWCFTIHDPLGHSKTTSCIEDARGFAEAHGAIIQAIPPIEYGPAQTEKGKTP